MCGECSAIVVVCIFVIITTIFITFLNYSFHIISFSFIFFTNLFLFSLPSLGSSLLKGLMTAVFHGLYAVDKGGPILFFMVDVFMFLLRLRCVWFTHLRKNDGEFVHGILNLRSGGLWSGLNGKLSRQRNCGPWYNETIT